MRDNVLNEAVINRVALKGWRSEEGSKKMQYDTNPVI